jgi:hypothetical protein
MKGSILYLFNYRTNLEDYGLIGRSYPSRPLLGLVLSVLELELFAYLWDLFKMWERSALYGLPKSQQASTDHPIMHHALAPAFKRNDKIIL